MPKAKLTPSFVRTVTCPPAHTKVDYFDTEQRGFMLEVRASGGRTYYQRYTDGRGRIRQFKVGPADVLTLEQARRKARSILADTLIGADPQEQREQLRETPTIAQFVRDRYLPYARERKTSWVTDQSLLHHLVRAIGSLGLDEVKPDHLSALIASMQAQGYANGSCNRLRSVGCHMFNLARKWKVPGAPVDNPFAGLDALPEQHRQRFLSVEEVKRLMTAAKAEHPQLAAMIKLLLITGARRGEVLGAKWDHIDWQNQTLLVPRAKSGKPRLIALNDSAVALLRSLPQTDTRLFPDRQLHHSARLYPIWHRIRDRANLPDLRLHDLRHSFASFLVNDGASLYLVQELLGHSNPRMTQRYAHLAPTTLRKATEVVGKLVDDATAEPLESSPEQCPPPEPEVS